MLSGEPIPIRYAQGKPLTPSPNSDIELNWKIILFGEGESFERRLRPPSAGSGQALSRRTPIFLNCGIVQGKTIISQGL
jgi:hypothetical protein